MIPHDFVPAPAITAYLAMRTPEVCLTSMNWRPYPSKFDSHLVLDPYAWPARIMVPIYRPTPTAVILRRSHQIPFKSHNPRMRAAPFKRFYPK